MCGDGQQAVIVVVAAGYTIQKLSTVIGQLEYCVAVFANAYARDRLVDEPVRRTHKAIPPLDLARERRLLLPPASSSSSLSNILLSLFFFFFFNSVAGLRRIQQLQRIRQAYLPHNQQRCLPPLASSNPSHILQWAYLSGLDQSS